MESTPGPACPDCGAAMLAIVFGMPDADLFEAADRGEVMLGGCVIGEREPSHECPSCHAQAVVDEDGGIERFELPDFALTDDRLAQARALRDTRDAGGG